IKTDAVMCIALTRQSPSRTRLSLTAFSTSPVMFTKSIRSGTFTVRYFVRDSMGRSPPDDSFLRLCVRGFELGVAHQVLVEGSVHRHRDFAQDWDLLGDRAGSGGVCRDGNYSRADEAHYCREHSAGVEVVRVRRFEDGVALEQFRAGANQILVVGE